MAHSSRGLGHLPLKEEITGSNPVCATNAKIAPCFEANFDKQGAYYYSFANKLLIMIFNSRIFTPTVKQSIKTLRRRLLKSWGDVAISIKRHGYGRVS